MDKKIACPIRTYPLLIIHCNVLFPQLPKFLDFNSKSPRESPVKVGHKSNSSNKEKMGKLVDQVWMISPKVNQWSLWKLNSSYLFISFRGDVFSTHAFPAGETEPTALQPWRNHYGAVVSCWPQRCGQRLQRVLLTAQRPELHLPRKGQNCICRAFILFANCIFFTSSLSSDLPTPLLYTSVPANNFFKANILLKFFYMVATRKLAVMGPLTR